MYLYFLALDVFLIGGDTLFLFICFLFHCLLIYIYKLFMIYVYDLGEVKNLFLFYLYFPHISLCVC